MQAILRRDMYGLGAPGFPIEKVEDPESNPLANPLCSSDSGDDELKEGGAVDRFFRAKCIYWLEALAFLEACQKTCFFLTTLPPINHLFRNAQMHAALFIFQYRICLSAGI